MHQSGGKVPFLELGPRLRCFAQGDTPGSLQRPTASCPSPAGASLCPSNLSCGPRPEARPTRTLPEPPARPVRSCETRCLLASRCPAKYRHQVRPAGPNLAAWKRVGGGTRRPLPPAETPPARLAAVAEAGGGYLVLSRAGVLSQRLFCGVGRGTPGAEGGVGAVRGPALGRAFRPLPAALSCRLRCSPSCCCHQPGGAGPDGGRGQAKAATPCPARESPASQLRLRRKNGESQRVCAWRVCELLRASPFAPRLWVQEAQALRPKRGNETGSHRE